MKVNPAILEIHSLYRRQAIHLLVYGFISGAQWVLPSVSKKDSANAFLRCFKAHCDSLDEKDIIDIYDSVNRDILGKRYEKRNN